MDKETLGLRYHLPWLLKTLAEPTTCHTAPELWCRIRSADWEECVPILRDQLASEDADVIRLTLNILFEEVSNIGTDNLDVFQSAIISCLAHDNRLVRQAAIHVLHEARCDDSTAIQELWRIVKDDESIIRREAAHALLDLDDSVLDRLAVLR